MWRHASVLQATVAVIFGTLMVGDLVRENGTVTTLRLSVLHSGHTPHMSAMINPLWARSWNDTAGHTAAIAKGL